MSADRREPPSQADAARDWAERRRKKKEARKGQSYGQLAKSGAAWSMFRQGGNELFGIPVSIVMARLLSPHRLRHRRRGLVLPAAGGEAHAVRVHVGAGPREGDAPRAHLVGVRGEPRDGCVSYLSLVAISPFVGAFFRSPEAGRRPAASRR